MRRTAGYRCLVAAGILLGAAVIGGSLAGAEDQQPETLARPHEMVGTLSCMSASCHGTSDSGQGGDLARHVYVHWLGAEAKYRDGRRAYDPRAVLEKSDADPHALAGQRMLEPRFREVLRRASLRADGSVDAGMYGRCAKCHDPNPHAPQEGSVAQSVTSPQGIGCESCHGAANGWIAVHYERDISRERLKQLGMVDTKDLLVRARQCAACHVGSADQDMNHDMIAAGHPPLRFEMASYEALLPRKHWDDRSRRLADPNYEVQLWAAGRVAAAEAALALLEGRAERVQSSAFGVQEGDRRQESGNRSQAVWPEFAETNCFACHQPLRAETGPRRVAALPAAKPGVPPWQAWNTALVPAHDDSFTEAIGRLRAAMERSLVPHPAEVAGLAKAAKLTLHQHVQDDLAIDARQVLLGLASPNEASSWDKMCQQLAALVAVERSLFDRGVVDPADLDSLRQRLRRLAVALGFETGGSEWPRMFAKSGGISPAAVAQEMAAIRDQLAQIAAREAIR